MLHLPFSDKYKLLAALNLISKIYPKNVAGECSNLDEACLICGDVKAQRLRQGWSIEGSAPQNHAMAAMAPLKWTIINLVWGS